MKIEDYRMHSAFATEYGTFLGLAWTAVFALYVVGIRTTSIMLMLFGSLAMLALPLLGFSLGRRFRRHLSPETHVGFGRAWWFSLMMHMYACLLTGAAEFAYFRYMDHGALIQTFTRLSTDPAVVQVYTENGMLSTLNLFNESISQVASLSAFELTLSLFNQNFILSLILSLPTALFVRKSGIKQ